MPNVSNIIAGHNKNILQQDKALRELGCNCKGGSQTCPLKGKCQTESLVYKATVTSPDNTVAEYIGQSSTSFKTRFNNHTSSFRNQRYSKNTALSSHFWNVKEIFNQSPTIDWSIMSLAPTYKTETGRCQLCLLEKTLIINSKTRPILNKRSEVMNKCRHKPKLLLMNC